MKNYYLFLLLSFFIQSLNGQYLVPYKKGDLYGYSTLDGKIMITPKYTKASIFNHNGYAAVYKNEEAFIIDSLGKPVKHIKGLAKKQWKFDKLRSYDKYNFIAQIDSLNLFIDANFNLLFKVKETLDGFTSDFKYARVLKGKRPRDDYYAIIRDDGKTIIPFSTDYIRMHYSFRDSFPPLFSMKRDGKYYIYDAEGKPVLDTIYDIRPNIFRGVKDTYFILLRNDTVDILSSHHQVLFENLSLTGYMDSVTYQNVLEKVNYDNKVLFRIFGIPKSVRCDYTWSDHCICFRKNAKGKQEAVYRNGKSVLKAGEEKAFYNIFSERIAYQKMGKWGVRNAKGEDLIPLFEGKFKFFSNKKAFTIYTDDLYYYYSPEGEFLGGPYDDISNCKIKKPDSPQYAFHCYDGVPRTAFKYDEVETLLGRVAYLVRKGNHCEIIDTNAVVMQSFDCETYEETENKRFIRITKDEKQGLIHWAGELILPLEYEYISITDKKADYPFIFARRAGGPLEVFRWDGQVVDINMERESDFESTVYKDGYYKILYPDGKNRYFDPDGKLIATQPPLKEERLYGWSQVIARKYGLLKIEEVSGQHYYFNYRTGVVYKE
jgi:hypothetical protein